MGFGTTADEYDQQREQGDTGVWIQNFRDPETRIRLLQEPGTFGSIREHYSRRFKEFFPCDEDEEFGVQCVGCTDPDPETRQRNRRFVTNLLNDKGELKLYKMGVGLRKKFMNKKQRVGTVLDRDYIVIKTGKGLDTDYDAESGEQYDVPFPGPLVDIGQTLKEKYAEVLAKYGAAGAVAQIESPTTSSAPATTAAAPTGRIVPQVPGATATAPIVPQAAATPAATPAAPSQTKPQTRTEQVSQALSGTPGTPAEAAPWEGGEAGGPQEPTPLNPEPTTITDTVASNGNGLVYKAPEQMTIGELRAWLSDPEREVSFPENAARSRLVKLAQKWVLDNAEA